MAHPIHFVPKKHDPKLELMKQVEAAPQEHAEALLRAWEVLQTAHDKGLLDLANGLMGGKDVIVGKLAEAASLPESVAAIRNVMAMARVLGSLDPEVLQRLAKGLGGNLREEKEQKQMDEEKEHRAPHVEVKDEGAQERPPSLWRIFRMATSSDARRGIGFTLNLLTALGRATRSDS